MNLITIILKETAVYSLFPHDSSHSKLENSKSKNKLRLKRKPGLSHIIFLISLSSFLGTPLTFGQLQRTNIYTKCMIFDRLSEFLSLFSVSWVLIGLPSQLQRTGKKRKRSAHCYM